MTQREKDKIWADYFITWFFYNKKFYPNGGGVEIIGAYEFSKEKENPIRQAQETATENYQSWNWKHEII